MTLVVFEDEGFRDLLPLTYVRAAFELRCGCDALLDKILTAYPRTPHQLRVRSALQPLIAERFPSAAPAIENDVEDCLWINARAIVTDSLALGHGTACWQDGALVAARFNGALSRDLSDEDLLDAARLRARLRALHEVPVPPAISGMIRYPWDLIARNADELRRQAGNMPPDKLGRISPAACLLNSSAIHVGAESVIKPMVVLDAEEGPIHVGRGVTISPGAVLKGPCSIGDGSLVQAGASIREGASIGPVCKVGGEIEGSIFQGYANKQHDGFVGHSYVGEWTNLGADTVTSDLKNTYGPVAMPLCGKKTLTGQRFLGMVAGDFSKLGICTAITTGTCIGIFCNVVCPRPPQFVRSFSWMTAESCVPHQIDKALAVARIVMNRRKLELTPTHEAYLRSLPSLVAGFEPPME